MEIAILIGAVSLWGGVHSWLASRAVKSWMGRLVGERPLRAHRLAYNAFAAVSFAPILWLMRTLPDRLLYDVPAAWRYGMLAGQALAALALMLTLLQTGALAFAGWRQITGATARARLVTTGFYHWVRHPLYLFGLLVLWLTPSVTANTLAVYASLTIYIIVGATFEERKLLREFGAEYAAYRSRTAMIVPGLRPPGRKAKSAIDGGATLCRLAIAQLVTRQRVTGAKGCGRREGGSV